MSIVDLGCGNAPKGDINIDCVGPPATQADHICLLGFEPIPLDDSSVDKFISHHFLEHVPHVVYRPEVLIIDNEDDTKNSVTNWGRYQPTVQLFNEMYRCLKDGGTFECTVPVFPHPHIFQDPTHVSFWTTETVRYFSGDYYGFHESYSHTSRFELMDLKVVSFWMEFVMMAIKDVEDDHPYLLDYGRAP